MLSNTVISLAVLLLCSSSLVSALIGGTRFHYTPDSMQKHRKRTNFPKPAKGLKTFTTPTGVKIRYKEPGICETTPGVKSFSGYIDLSPTIHVFFYFFESRSNPAQDPLTLWLNGGPGSDSLIGLFQENGPCRISPNLTSVLNPYSWNDASNLLYLSQPVGAGFSYQKIANGSVYDSYTGSFFNSSVAPPEGTYPVLDPTNVGEIDTTQLAAISAWHVLQGFLSGHKRLGAVIGQSRDFNLFTESFGGHYGPAFFDYFLEQNTKIQNGSMKGYPLNFNALGIGNGIISEMIQAPWYPEMAVNNTYGIKAYNDTVYNYAKFAVYMRNGCLDQIQTCIEGAAQPLKGGVVSLANGSVITTIATSNPNIDTLCAEAGNMCRDNVESPYYWYSGRGTYDIRHPERDPIPPNAFYYYLNQGYVQEALGVSLNYTEVTLPIYWEFQNTGDWIYPNFLAELENLLDLGVRVSLYYGDADYICNWLGGQAVSMSIKYTHSSEFRAAGYAPLMYGGVQYGVVREYGNFSFTRVFESGHEVPYYQPQAALAIFNRTINLVDIATGDEKVTPDLGSSGPSTASHTEKAPTLAPESGSAFSSWATRVAASYASQDNKPLASSLSIV